MTHRCGHAVDHANSVADSPMRALIAPVGSRAHSQLVPNSGAHRARGGARRGGFPPTNSLRHFRVYRLVESLRINRSGSTSTLSHRPADRSREDRSSAESASAPIPCRAPSGRRC
jgi:hypothetical protein